MGPMTQARSRWLGRAILATAAIHLWLALSMARRRWWLIPLALALALAAAVEAWVGTTMVVMNWDNPADYPPAEQPTD